MGSKLNYEKWDFRRKIFIFVFILLRCSQICVSHPDRRSSSLPFEDCGSKYELLSVQVSSCTYAPCRIPIGSTVHVTSQFNSATTLASMTVLQHNANWIINNVYSKASVTPELCSTTGGCPTYGDEGLLVQADLQVPGTMPTLRGSLYWRVYNSANEIVLCYKIPITLTT